MWRNKAKSSVRKLEHSWNTDVVHIHSNFWSVSSCSRCRSLSFTNRYSNIRIWVYRKKEIIRNITFSSRRVNSQSRTEPNRTITLHLLSQYTNFIASECTSSDIKYSLSWSHRLTLYLSQYNICYFRIEILINLKSSIRESESSSNSYFASSHSANSLHHPHHVHCCMMTHEWQYDECRCEDRSWWYENL